MRSRPRMQIRPVSALLAECSGATGAGAGADAVAAVGASARGGGGTADSNSDPLDVFRTTGLSSVDVAAPTTAPIRLCFRSPPPPPPPPPPCLPLFICAISRLRGFPGWRACSTLHVPDAAGAGAGAGVVAAGVVGVGDASAGARWAAGLLSNRKSTHRSHSSMNDCGTNPSCRVCVHESASQSVSQSVSRSVSQPASQPVSKPASQPVSQSASQPISQPASQSLNQGTRSECAFQSYAFAVWFMLYCWSVSIPQLSLSSGWCTILQKSP